MKIEKIEAIRKELPSVSSCVYLNTGTNGPLCRATAEVMKKEAEKEYQEGRYLPFISELYKDMDETRVLISDFIGADFEEIALTHTATEGMNLILWGINWQPGDEIITTNREHVASLAPISLIKNKFSINVKYVNAEYGNNYREQIFFDSFKKMITPKSKLLVISHVSFSTGLTFPIKKLAEICHENNMSILVDGAQGAGAVPLNVHEFGIDFYSLAGRKWLLGPEGISALYVARHKISEVDPTFISPSSIRDRHDLDIASPYIIPAPYAARYQTATSINRSILLGFKEALKFISNDVGKEWMLSRINDLILYLREKLEIIPGVVIVTPKGKEGGFIHFLIKDREPVEFCTAMNKRSYMIRPVPSQHFPAPIRVSVGFYNTKQELDGLIENIKEVMNP